MMVLKRNLTTFLILCFCVAVIPSMQAQSVMQKLKSGPQTDRFAEALDKTDLGAKLERSGPYTLFVPYNKAFSRLATGQKADRDLLLNHIFTGMATVRSLKAMSEVTCLSGRTIKIESGQQLTVDSYRILQSNIRADNGVIHIIEGVIR